MASTVNYNSGQSQQIEDLRSYIEDYCSANQIDPAIYTQYLDGQRSLDPAILRDPAFQAYWQLAYLQLMEIINPSLVQSLQAEVGEVDFATLQARAGDDLNEFMEQLVLDNPEFMSFAALTDGNAATTPEALRQLLATPAAGSGNGGQPQYRDEQARDMARQFGMGPAYDWLIDTEEGIRSTEQWLMQGLSEMDQQLADLAEALRSGEMSAEEFQAKTENISQYRQLYLGMIQNLEDTWGGMLEMMSNMVKANNDLQLALSRNLNVPA